MDSKPQNRIVQFQDWGQTDYADAWERQKQLLQVTVNQKLAERAGEALQPTPNFLIFTEHLPVYTLGKSGKEANLLTPLEQLPGVSYYAVERGGDITYHGPGQLVGYPIFDLENFFTDLHRYMRAWEEVLIQTLAEWGIQAGRLKGATGVWIEPESPKARKIAAMGIKCSRWVTMHGFALNINPDLSAFQHIIPCGIVDKGVTSMSQELGYIPKAEAVKECVRLNAAKIFEFDYVV